MLCLSPMLRLSLTVCLALMVSLSQVQELHLAGEAGADRAQAHHMPFVESLAKTR